MMVQTSQSLTCTELATEGEGGVFLVIVHKLPKGSQVLWSFWQMHLLPS